MEKLFALAHRVAFALALLMALLGVAEGVVQLLGHSLVRHAYTAGRLLEFATMLMVFVIAFQLRESAKLKP